MINEELIHLCRKGNNAAQKILYNHFATKMFRLCLRYIKNEQDAESALIDGFLKVFQNIESFEYRDNISFEAWIKKIMVNESLMQLRKKNNFNLTVEIEDGHIDTNPLVDSDLSAADIYQFIRTLPDGYRTVFNLYAIEGYSHNEIALQLNISESTSKSQLSKARAMLKNLVIKNEIYHER